MGKFKYLIQDYDMSKDYIDIPLNEEQISKVIEYRDYISEFTYDYWFAGSFVLSLFLDDKIDPPNDLDIFINSKKSPIEIFEEFQNKDKSFRYHRMSKFAVTVKRNGWLPLQLIPVSCSGIEELLDTFDLTLASIGIFSDNEGVFFKVHTDILTTHFGLPPKGKFRNSSENKNLHIIKRAMNIIALVKKGYTVLKCANINCGATFRLQQAQPLQTLF